MDNDHALQRHTALEAVKARLESLRHRLRTASAEAQDQGAELDHEIRALESHATPWTVSTTTSLLSRLRELEARLVCPD